MPNSHKLSPHLTDDGSYTFFSQEYGETYHSISGARQEAEKKFIESCQIIQKAREQPSLKLLDICYGLGYNTAASLTAIWTANLNCRVELIALEIDEQVPQSAIDQGLLENWIWPVPQVLATLAAEKQLATPQLQARLLIGDARQTLQQVQKYYFDAIFLDPFSPTKCPQLWTVEFLSRVARCLSPTGYLATYSCAASVRTALQMAGLSIGATQGVGRRSPGTVASWQPDCLQSLSEQEREHLQTKAAIPYRDPMLMDTAESIRQRRIVEQQASLLEPTSHWKKRWQNFRKKTELS
jgi:tRNA U34 5-methylaminomethyl-2-thiouridine-forming methyltransferase MnmC